MNTTNGINSHPSPYSVSETIDRLSAILQAKGITIFARIDQRVEAENWHDSRVSRVGKLLASRCQNLASVYLN